MARILVVDDSPFFRRRTRGVLERGGHEVLEASDVTDAVKTVFREAPDGLVMDLILPDGDGLVLLEELRRRNFEGPVIVVTSDLQPMTRHLATTHGATCVLHEPVATDEILHALEGTTSLV